MTPLAPQQEEAVSSLLSNCSLLAQRDLSFDEEVLLAYAERANGGQLSILLYYPALPESVTTRMVTHPAATVLVLDRLAARSDLGEATQVALYEREVQVRDILAKSRVVTPRVQELLATDGPHLCRLLSQNPSLTPEMQRFVYEKHSNVTRTDLAQNPNLSLEMQKLLLENHWMLEAKLAGNPALDPALQWELSKRDQVLVPLAGNRNLIRPLQVMFSRRGGVVQGVLARNPHVVPGDDLAPGFLVRHHHDWVVRTTPLEHLEMVESMAASWHGDLQSLKEACRLIR